MGTADGEGVVERAIIVNKRGLHARAAAKFVTLAERFSASLDVSREDQTVSALSIMGLMMLGAGRGCEIRISGKGPDAARAVRALADLVRGGFGEQE